MTDAASNWDVMPSTERVSRRHALALLGSGVLAGCLNQTNSEAATKPTTQTPGETTPESSDPESATPTETATRLDSGWVKLNLVPTKPREIVDRAVRNPSSFDSGERETLNRVASEGSVTVHDSTLHSELPLHPPYLVELEGAIFLLNKQITDSEEVKVRRFRIEVLEQSRDDARAFAELSTLDQAIVKRGLPEEYLTNGTPFGGTFFYKFEGQSPTNSWIVDTDGDVFIAYGEDTLRLQSTGSDTVVEEDVRYELTEVASNRSAAREYVTREYVRNVSTDELPASQREILTAAINSSEGYREEGQGSQPFLALQDRLDTVPQVPNDGRYIRYNGTIYQVVQTGVEA